MSTPNSNGAFQTDSLPFACFLVSAKKLQFLRCEPSDPNGRVMFVFDDPQELGEKLYLDFVSGAVAPASAFFEAIRHLRKIMDQTLKQSTDHGAKEHARIFR